MSECGDRLTVSFLPAFFTVGRTVNHHPIFAMEKSIFKGWTLFLQFGGFYALWGHNLFELILASNCSKWFKYRLNWTQTFKITSFGPQNTHPPLRWTHNQHLLQMMKKNGKNDQNSNFHKVAGNAIGHKNNFPKWFSSPGDTFWYPACAHTPIRTTITISQTLVKNWNFFQS